MKVSSVDGGVAVVSLTDSNGQPFSPEQSTSKAQHTEFPKLNIVTGDFAGYLVYEDVEESVFYIQKTEDTDLINQVASDVEKLSLTDAPVDSPMVGQACIAKFKDDGVWYRAEILSTTNGVISVRFIDYGNSTTVEKSELRHIDEQLNKIPPLAVPCQHAASAAGLNLTDWAVDEITMTVTNKSNGKAVVSLKNANGESFVEAKSPEPSKTIISHIGFDSLKSVARACHQLGEFKGYLTHEVSQQKFFFQKTADTELIEKVTEQVAAESSCNSPLVSPADGQMCIAMFKDELDDEGAWYRALIMSAKDENAEVFFVDFGNSTYVNKKELLTISDDLGTISPLAVRCTLPREDSQKNLSEWAAGTYLSVTLKAIRKQSIHGAYMHISLAVYTNYQLFLNEWSM